MQIRDVAGLKMSNDNGSHDRHAGHSVAMFRDKFWLSFALTIPVVFWSTDVQHWLGYTAPSFPGSKFIPAILGTVVFVYGGLVFIRGAWGELADHKPGMMTLISLAIIVAFGTSLAATFGLFEIDVWWELASLIYDHGPRPLAGNAGHFPGSWRAQCSRRATPGHR
jgi:Cu2+-exporting ATPase